MNRLKMFLSVAAAIVAVLAINIERAEAQTVTTRTTLKTAITTTGGTVTVTPNSMTSIVALSAQGNQNGISSTQNFCLIDGELGSVVNGTVTTTTFGWRRPNGGSQHAVNAEIRCGPGGFAWTPSAAGGGTTAGIFTSNPSQKPSGSCTRAANQFLPVFAVLDGHAWAYDCPNNISTTTGQWVEWQVYPPAADGGVWSRTPLAFAGTAVSPTYTALPADYLIAITSTLGTANTNVVITFVCNGVPAGKTWVLADEGGGAGTSSTNINVAGNFASTTSVSTGFSSVTIRSDGTKCYKN